MKKIGFLLLMGLFVISGQLYSQVTITWSSVWSGCDFNYRLTTYSGDCSVVNTTVTGVLPRGTSGSIVDPGAGPGDIIYRIEIFQYTTCTNATWAYNVAPYCMGIQAGGCSNTNDCTGNGAYNVQINGVTSFLIL